MPVTKAAVAEAAGLDRGTRVRLHLKEAGEEGKNYLAEGTLRSLVHRYSDFVEYPIRLGEDTRVRLPVIVNLDGFYLSFTREPVDIPDAAAAAGFLPPFEAENIRFRASAPASQAVAVLGSGPYSYFRYESHLAAQNALEVYDELAQEFAAQFGRNHPAVDAYRCEDAEVVLVMIGCFATKARDAVDRLRDSGVPVGLLRPRLVRPWPGQALYEALRGKRAVAVIDQNLAPGKGGVLHGELASVLYGQPDAPPVLASFIGGLGGRDISAEEFYEIAALLVLGLAAISWRLRLGVEKRLVIAALRSVLQLTLLGLVLKSLFAQSNPFENAGGFFSGFIFSQGVGMFVGLYLRQLSRSSQWLFLHAARFSGQAVTGLRRRESVPCFSIIRYSNLL